MKVLNLYSYFTLNHNCALICRKQNLVELMKELHMKNVIQNMLTLIVQEASYLEDSAVA